MINDKPTIQQTLNHFLDDQQKRLKEKTFEKYKSVIELYESYLDNYAYLVLDNEEHAYFEEQFNKHNRMFCELFGPDKILDGYFEFFGYFLPKKVLAGEDFFRNCGTVLKKLAKWLEEKGYAVNEDAVEAIETSSKGGKDAADANKIGNALFDFAEKFPLDKKLSADDEDFIESFFVIHKIEDNVLYLQDDEDPDKEIYTVQISERLAGMLKKATDWRVWMELVRTKSKGKEKWNIAVVGSVYPM